MTMNCCEWYRKKGNGTAYKYDETEDFEPLPCDHPTDAIPGTAERLAEYIARIERGEALFHEEDFVFCDPGPQLDFLEGLNHDDERRQPDADDKQWLVDWCDIQD